MTLQNLALSHKKLNSFTLEVRIFLEPQFLGNFTRMVCYRESNQLLLRSTELVVRSRWLLRISIFISRYYISVGTSCNGDGHDTWYILGRYSNVKS